MANLVYFYPIKKISFNSSFFMKTPDKYFSQNSVKSINSEFNSHLQFYYKPVVGTSVFYYKSILSIWDNKKTYIYEHLESEPIDNEKMRMKKIISLDAAFNTEQFILNANKKDAQEWLEWSNMNYVSILKNSKHIGHNTLYNNLLFRIILNQYEPSIKNIDIFKNIRKYIKKNKEDFVLTLCNNLLELHTEKECNQNDNLCNCGDVPNLNKYSVNYNTIDRDYENSYNYISLLTSNITIDIFD